jgi:hypothetical protein
MFSGKHAKPSELFQIVNILKDYESTATLKVDIYGWNVVIFGHNHAVLLDAFIDCSDFDKYVLVDNIKSISIKVNLATLAKILSNIKESVWFSIQCKSHKYNEKELIVSDGGSDFEWRLNECSNKIEDMPQITDFDYNYVISILPKYWVECQEKLMVLGGSKIILDVSEKYLILSTQDGQGSGRFKMNLSKPKTLLIKRPQLNSNSNAMETDIDTDIENCITKLTKISIKTSNNNPYTVLECKEHMFQCVYKLDYLHEFSKKISSIVEKEVLLQFSVDLPFKIECVINENTGTTISFYLAPYN